MTTPKLHFSSLQHRLSGTDLWSPNSNQDYPDDIIQCSQTIKSVKCLFNHLQSSTIVKNRLRRLLLPFLPFISSRQNAVQPVSALLRCHSVSAVRAGACPVRTPRLPAGLPRARAGAVHCPAADAGHAQDSAPIGGR